MTLLSHCALCNVEQLELRDETAGTPFLSLSLFFSTETVTVNGKLCTDGHETRDSM